MGNSIECNMAQRSLQLGNLQLKQLKDVVVRSATKSFAPRSPSAPGTVRLPLERSVAEALEQLMHKPPGTRVVIGGELEITKEELLWAALVGDVSAHVNITYT